MLEFFSVMHLGDLRTAQKVQCKSFGPEWWFIPLVTFYKKGKLHCLFKMGHDNSTIENLRTIELEINPDEWFIKEKL